MAKMNYHKRKMEDAVKHRQVVRRQPQPSDVDARNLALAYDGTFPFMLDMKRKANDPSWIPTYKQKQAIFRCSR